MIHQNWPVNTHKWGEREILRLSLHDKPIKTRHVRLRVACDSTPPFTRNWLADKMESKSNGEETYPKRNGYHSLTVQHVAPPAHPVTGHLTAKTLCPPSTPSDNHPKTQKNNSLNINNKKTHNKQTIIIIN